MKTDSKMARVFVVTAMVARRFPEVMWGRDVARLVHGSNPARIYSLPHSGMTEKFSVHINRKVPVRGSTPSFVFYEYRAARPGPPFLMV